MTLVLGEPADFKVKVMKAALPSHPSPVLSPGAKIKENLL